MQKQQIGKSTYMNQFSAIIWLFTIVITSCLVTIYYFVMLKSHKNPNKTSPRHAQTRTLIYTYIQNIMGLTGICVFLDKHGLHSSTSIASNSKKEKIDSHKMD